MSATRRSSLSTAMRSKNPCEEGSSISAPYPPGFPNSAIPEAWSKRSELAEVVQALLEAAGMRLLGAGERLEPLGDLGEALLARCPRESRVHLRVLVGLTLDRGLEVQVRASDRESRS